MSRVNFSLLNIPGLPVWADVLIFAVDLIIRVVALCWIPYNRKPTVALGWLMAIFLIPYVGLIVFLLIGSRHLPKSRRERQRHMNEIISGEIGDRPILGEHDHIRESNKAAAALNYELGSLPLTGGNRFELLPDNHESLRAMAEAVDQAQKYVHFEFYIVAYDQTSQILLDALFRAKERGVKVHVLIDHLGSLGYPGYAELTKMLTRAGVSWRRMLPIRPWLLEYQRPDLRNHRKILVVDGDIGFSGSQNIIDRSYNKRKNLRKKLAWKDLMVRVDGPLVDELNALFISDWYSETGDLLLDEVDQEIPTVDGGALAQVVPSGPGFETENNLRLINHLIYNADRRIIICSPYFVPDDSLKMALTTAAASGIEVDLIVCEKGDQFFAHYGQASYYGQLLDAGIRLHLYPAPTVLHTKFMLIDDEMCFLGSSNMDQRSFSLNLEVSMMIVDQSMTSAVEEIAQEYIGTCYRLNAEEWKHRPLRQKALENVCRLTSALL